MKICTLFHLSIHFSIHFSAMHVVPGGKRVGVSTGLVLWVPGSAEKEKVLGPG